MSRNVIAPGYTDFGDIQWLTKAIGEPFPLFDHIEGVEPPPTGSANFRFILLTAGEDGEGDYNEGVLTNESVSGSDPLIEATAEIDFEASPLHGQTVRLINTTREFLRPGSAGTAQAMQADNIRDINRQVTDDTQNTITPGADGAYSPVIRTGASDGVNVAIRYRLWNRETRPRNLGASYYMRIF